MHSASTDGMHLLFEDKVFNFIYYCIMQLADEKPVVSESIIY